MSSLRSLGLSFTACLLAFPYTPAFATPMELFDFQSSDFLKQWNTPPATEKHPALSLSKNFARLHPHSLELYTPAWVPGKSNEWPAWTIRWDRKGPVASDWSSYDRFVIDVVNPTDTVALIGLKVADEELGRLSPGTWTGVKTTVAPRSFQRTIYPMTTMMKALTKDRLDIGSITTLLLYATRPTSDFRLNVTNITLLQPGDEAPALSDDFVEALRKLHLDPLLQQGRETVARLKESTPHAKRYREQWDQLATEAGKPLAPEVFTALGAKMETLLLEIRRTLSLAALYDQAEADGATYAVAWAPSTEKVIPREAPVANLDPKSNARLSVARQETEGIQLVVLPVKEDLKNVKIEIGKFRHQKQSDAPALPIDVRTVGFVKTERPAYEVDYVGWWPDPLLDFLSAIDIPAGDTQSFWVRARPGADQPAGIYEGEIRITPDNAPAITRKLTVQVRNFTVPTRPPIPVVIPAGHEGSIGKFITEPWGSYKLKLADFQADYYIGWDNLYAQGAPDWEVLEHLRKQDRLWQFNLYALGFGGGNRKILENGEYIPMLQRLIGEIKPVYEEAKKRDLLQYAYFYGMDEVPGRYFPAVRQIAQEVKEAFPEVPISTTSSDHTYGRTSKADEVDHWVPLIHEYRPEVAAAARERGKQVWWYNCKTPAHPYPNQFTEYPAIELRLMHGAMSALYQPDGFLYYSLIRTGQPTSTPEAPKPARKAIASGPYTDWDPCALAFSSTELYNGEGYLIYPGPNGLPLASIRLENFRDGLEDLWYWKLLREKADSLTRKGKLSTAERAWHAKAIEALAVPPGIVTSSHEFTLDSSLLFAWRETLATLLETAPLTPSQP